MRRHERLAAAALGLVLIVVVASAAIRLGAEGDALRALRLAHRTAATLEVFLVLALAWRVRLADPAVVVACALTIFLSVVGISGGRNPSPAASLGNILGGLALAACFAWMFARRPLSWIAALVALQCALGAWFSVFGRGSASELRLGHVLLGTALALGMMFRALRAERPTWRFALVLLALAVPAAGIATAASDRALAPALAHATAAALLVAVVSFAQPRLA